ncbi:MAG: hypothetical protein A2X59_02150 [Nitrospirae bacterium GWC2_42_7]|nr:MAG: hypothetical protein A2X59_02150 [Nitrospirae bacterium GWC2_42_7]
MLIHNKCFLKLNFFLVFNFLCLFIFFFLVFNDLSCASSEKLRVVASIAPLADFAKQVGGDKADVLLLLPPGASGHTYEPSPRMMQKTSKAQVFIKIGAGLEFWADKLITAANRDVIVVNCSEGIELIEGNGHSHDHDKGFKLNNIHTADPHIWLDPVICITIVKKIEDSFSKADPVNSSYYKKNAAAYLTKLSALDREIEEKVKTFSIKEYVTFHQAWNYFSRRYGLRVAGVIEESPGKEPSPKHISKILKELKRINIKVVFAEPQSSAKIAEAIAREAGGKVLTLDPVGGQKDRETYIELMRYNLAVLEKAMK